MSDLLWVVEMLDNGIWNPTVGVALCRADGRRVLADWSKNNPPDKFRLVKYRREPK